MSKIQKRVCDGVILTKNAILTSASCPAKPGGKVFYKTFDLKARKVPRTTIVSSQKHRKAKRIKLKNKKGIGHGRIRTNPDDGAGLVTLVDDSNSSFLCPEKESSKPYPITFGTMTIKSSRSTQELKFKMK